MKILSRLFSSLLVAAIAAYFVIPLAGCKVDAPSLYDPGTLPAPVVDSLSPAGSALAGIDTISIYGKNFSPNKSDDGVFFNSTLVNNTSIITASTTKLTLRAPAIAGDTIAVRVFVVGAVDFSQTLIYKLKAAIGPFSSFAAGEGAYGVTIGADGNLYASLSNANLAVKDEGIFKINADGSIATPAYVLPTTSPINTSWLSLKFGPSGYVYAVKGTRAAYRLAPSTTNPGSAAWAVFSSGSLNDMDFDPNHNLWFGGIGMKSGSDTTNIAKATLAAATKGYHFTGSVRAVRYFSGYLYFAATLGAASQVWRAPIAADTLGTPELYYDVSSAYTGASPIIWGITFAADGDMYVGLDGPDYLVVVHPNGTTDKPYGLYVSSGVLSAPCKAFAWTGTTLYASTSDGKLLKIFTGKTGAPYYGTQ